MNSEPPPRGPTARRGWLTLAWWREQDEHMKAWVAGLGRDARPWTPRERTRAIMLLFHAIGWPCLLTPLVTHWLYPWLPQPHAELFYLWAATSLGGALLAHLKLAEGVPEGQPTTSEGPSVARTSFRR